MLCTLLVVRKGFEFVVCCHSGGKHTFRHYKCPIFRKLTQGQSGTSAGWSEDQLQSTSGSFGHSLRVVSVVETSNLDAG